jgi:uncharacterized protein
MTILAAAALVLVAGMIAAGYYGASLMLRPPNMSAMSVYPDRFGVPYENVSFPAADGHPLAGWFVPSPSGQAKTLLVCHGWGDNKGEILERTLFLNRAEGFNLLYLDFRGHGESAPSLVTMGKLELLDLAGAVAYLKKSRPRSAARLGIFGQSMGAAVAAMSLRVHPEIRAAVLESPFAGYRQVSGRWAWRHARVPAFPTIDFMMLWLRLRSGHRDIDAYSPELRVDGCRTPALLIAGELDTLMPPADVRRVYDRAAGPKEFWIVPGAFHAKCREAAPADYEARVADFFKANGLG